jgi:hypothetical protein
LDLLSSGQSSPAGIGVFPERDFATGRGGPRKTPPVGPAGNQLDSKPKWLLASRDRSRSAMALSLSVATSMRMYRSVATNVVNYISFNFGRPQFIYPLWSYRYTESWRSMTIINELP